MRLSAIHLFLAASLVWACGKNERDSHQEATGSAQTPQAQPSVAAPAPAPSPSASAAPAPHVEIQLASVANTMAFDKTKLSVSTGTEVHLILKNNATMATLPHNWALVKPGTEASVAAAGLKLGEPAGYIDVRDKNMLVHTPLAKPGETVEVTFTAPDPGNYPYICTVPGHYMMMKGVLTVTP